MKHSYLLMTNVTPEVSNYFQLGMLGIKLPVLLLRNVIHPMTHPITSRCLSHFLQLNLNFSPSKCSLFFLFLYQIQSLVVFIKFVLIKSVFSKFFWKVWNECSNLSSEIWPSIVDSGEYLGPCQTSMMERFCKNS